MGDQLPLHAESAVAAPVPPAEVFARLDDHRRAAAHMASRSPWMLGSTMKLEFDEREGRGLGARIRLAGTVLGIPLEVDEAVVVYEPPVRKVIETLGKPRLLVIGRYRLGFEVLADGGGSNVRVWIDYAPPNGIMQRFFGRLLGRLYARWCVSRMLVDAVNGPAGTPNTEVASAGSRGGQPNGKHL